MQSNDCWIIHILLQAGTGNEIFNEEEQSHVFLNKNSLLDYRFFAVNYIKGIISGITPTREQLTVFCIRAKLLYFVPLGFNP